MYKRPRGILTAQMGAIVVSQLMKENLPPQQLQQELAKLNIKKHHTKDKNSKSGKYYRKVTHNIFKTGTRECKRRRKQIEQGIIPIHLVYKVSNTKECVV